MFWYIAKNERGDVGTVPATHLTPITSKSNFLKCHIIIKNITMMETNVCTCTCNNNFDIL